MAPLTDNASSVADRLLRQFGSISGLIAADARDLRLCAGKGETWVEGILAARSIYLAGLQEEVRRSNLSSSDPAMRRLLNVSMRGLREERMMAVMADGNGEILTIETVCQGSSRHMILEPRKIFARALSIDCRRLIIAHNHPSGSPEPSQSDVVQTRRLCEQAHSLGIVIEDHLIVGRRGIVSMRERGLL